VLTASIIRANRPDDGAVSTSETFVNFYQTARHYNLEDSHIIFLYRINGRMKKSAFPLVCKTKINDTDYEAFHRKTNPSFSRKFMSKNECTLLVITTM
jgi:hypothetical protein